MQEKLGACVTYQNCLCCSAIHCYCIFCTMQDIKLAVHAHPTLSEVLDELFKSAKVSCTEHH